MKRRVGRDSYSTFWMSTARSVNPIRVVVTSTACAAASVMPALLLGASGVLVRNDLAFDEAGLGIAIAVFFYGSSVASGPGGRLVDRWGARRSLLGSVAVSASSLLLIGMAQSWSQLIAFLLVAGMANGVTQPATSLALARGVRRGRQGFSFGLKQAAIPAASLCAGVAVPLVGIRVGWRWIYAGAAVLALAAALSVQSPEAETVPADDERVDDDASRWPLAAIAVAAALGAGAATCLAAFTVESAIANGMSLSKASWLLGLGSLTGIGARLAVGWLADGRGSAYLLIVASMLTFGAGAYAMLALSDTPIALVAATLAAFIFGWGWPGLLMLAIVRLSPNNPGKATGIVQIGTSAGAATGPLLFGLLVVTHSFPVAWAMTAGMAAVSALLTVLARGWAIAGQAHNVMTARSEP